MSIPLWFYYLLVALLSLAGVVLVWQAADLRLYRNAIDILLSEIERLRGALHESRKDRERLDWLEAERASVFAVVEDEFDNRAVPALLRFSVEVDHYKTRIGGGFCDVTGVAPALREAIDAARAGNGETT